MIIQEKKPMVNVSKPKFYSKADASQPKPTIAAKVGTIFPPPGNNFFYKMLFGIFLIAVMAGLQLTAWYWGHNGLVFAFTSAIIGLAAGSILGFEWGLKRGSN